MTNPIDPVPRWTREVASLRAQAVKLRRGSVQPPCGDVMENALVTCDSLLQELAGARIECERLHAEVGTETAAWERLFDVVPVACLVTDGFGSILNANRAGGAFLNVSAKHLKHRQLLMFSADREAFGALMRRLRPGGGEHRTRLSMRPKERKPKETDILVVPLSDSEPGLWLWFLASNCPSPHAISEAANHIESFV